MREAESRIERESRAVFAARQSAMPETDIRAFYEGKIADAPRVDAMLRTTGEKWESAGALASQIRDLPETGTPLILAGGSFNSDTHTTRLHESARALIDTLLQNADPEKLFFVIGHKLSAHERYLVEHNRGRFAIFAIVPAAMSEGEIRRLQQSGVSVRISIEPSGNGLYKSFAYEIFKRRKSILLAFDGNSPAANLVQEAKNGRQKCAIYVSRRSRTLRAKARMLQGYVQLFEENTDFALKLLQNHALTVTE